MSRMQCREIAEYVCRLHAHTQPDSALGRKLTAWIREHDSVLGLDYAAATAKRGAKKRAPDDKPLPLWAWRQLARALKSRCGTQTANAVARNADTLATALGLTPVEISVLAFVAMTSHEVALEMLCDRLAETRAIAAEETIAVCLDLPVCDVVAATGAGALRALGLIDGTHDRPGRFDMFVPYDVLKALRPPNDTLAHIEIALVGAPVTSRLTPADFDHVARERDFLARLVAGAVTARRKGINILLYGPPGTGKTELAKVAARAAGCDLFAVGESNDGYEPKRHNRLAALRLADGLLGSRGGACLLFDEMEDIMQSGTGAQVDGRRIVRAGSKVYFNRLLEQNGVPVIWTANTIEEVDPAFLRRMSFVLEMRIPSHAVRARHWSAVAERNGVAIGPEHAAELARTHTVAPSAVEHAVEAAALAGGDAQHVELVVGNLAKVAGAHSAAWRPLAGACDLDLINADTDLAALEHALATRTPGGISFCLHGPPGTGKSLYARRLAERMGFTAVERRASDLLSKWLGESEQRITAMFDDAAASRTVIIIDEVETLFWERSASTKSWESSQVNAFLAGLDSHPMPFLCTTNHIERIDPAILRRLTFRVKLDALTKDQRAAAWPHFFEGEAPLAVARLDGLTPADFATVRKKADILGVALNDCVSIMAMLEQELAAKPHASARIGF